MGERVMEAGESRRWERERDGREGDWREREIGEMEMEAGESLRWERGKQGRESDGREGDGSGGGWRGGGEGVWVGEGMEGKRRRGVSGTLMG